MIVPVILFSIDLFIIGLFGLHLALGGRPTMFDLDGELILGAWWGGGKFLLASAAVASMPLFFSEKRVVQPALYWTVAAGFAWLSADEILALHEKITKYNKLLEIGLPMFQGANGAWIGVYAVLFALLVLIFFRPLLTSARADPKSAKLIAAGFVILVSGAVVVEVMGYFQLLGGMGSPLQVFIEESLELFGASVVLLGCVGHALWVSRQ